MKKWMKFILLVVFVIGILGGCSMKKVDEALIKDEQERMALFVVNYYENVKKIEFTSFKQNKTTGTWHSNAIVNDSIFVTFTVSNLGDKSDIGFGQHINQSDGEKLVEKSDIENISNLDTIQVQYYEVK